MKSDIRGALGRRSQALINKFSKKGLYGIAIAVLATTVVVSTGFARKLADQASTPPSDPIVSTMQPLTDATIAPLLALDRATEAVAQRVIPAVVQINVVGKTQVSQGGRGMQDIPAPFRPFFGGPFQMQPQSRVFQALGTGLIVSPNGYIVTNNHVVADNTRLTVTLHNHRQYDAKVVGTDKATDLAVIKIDASGLTSAAWGNSDDLRPGQTVFAIGDPLGMDFSVTRGIVSALNRPRNLGGNDPNARGTFIQTDAPINHGNSGGPLVDVHGQVVGINSEMLSNSGASAGIGFAIPSNLVKRTAAELIEHGKVVRGYLGIEVYDLTPRVAEALNEPDAQGALVNQVNGDSPAARAGIKTYDVITGFNGHKVSSGTDLQTYAGEAAPGSTAQIDILRDGKTMPVTLTVGDLAKSGASVSEAEAGEGGSTPKLGISVTPLTPDIRGQLQLPNDVNGVVVQSVEPGSPAMVAGLSRGDVIEQVNQHPVGSPAEMAREVQNSPAGRDVLLLVYTRNGTSIIPVHPQG